jgi:DHA2 family multidrug resistance protein
LPQIIRGLSAQLIFLPLVLLSLGELEENKIKNASGLYSLMGRLGSAIGIALSNTLFEYKISSSYESFTNLSSQAISKSDVIIGKIKHIIPQYLDNSPENMKMLMQILYKLATNEASAIAFNQIMLLMGFLAFIAAPLIYLVRGLKKNKKKAG